MNTSVADDMIRSYFDRWQRLEEEKRTISDDLKELFAEARGNGLDTKALRAVFREQAGDKAAIEEFDAICDLYRASLNAPRAGRARESQSYAEAKGVERTELEDTVAALREVSRQNGANFDGYDAETRTFPAERELTDTQEQPIDPARDEPEGEADASGDFERDTRQSVPADLTDGNIVTDGSSRSANSPSPANAPRLAADDEAAQANPTSSAPHSNPQPAASLGNADSPASTSSPEPGSLSDADVPQFLKPEQRKTVADYRPHCLNPDACGATGLTHCYVCRKAMEAASETEAA